MNADKNDEIKHFEIVDIDNSLAEVIKSEYGQEAFEHLHLEDGKSFAAMDGEKVVGFISISWKEFPYTFEDAPKEAYIDIIEVKPGYRRQGIARKLIEKCKEASQAAGCYQLRSWSSEDKKEAIPMWKKLGFGMHPQTTTSGRTGEDVNGYFVTKQIEKGEENGKK